MASIRVAYLGPAGTFSDEALTQAAGPAAIEKLPQPTVHAAVMAVEEGDAERAFVPLENAIEGAVRPTLDALALDAKSVRVAGEYDHPIHHSLIAARPLEIDAITAVLSHPQPSAQCARFLREELPGAEVRTAASTAEAVRLLGSSAEPWAALGPTAAAELYGCVVLREGVEDSPDNVTRFVWIAPGGDGAGEGDAWKTMLVFSELGEDHPGALVDALVEFSSRGVNLSRIESRPLRQGLGRYMFFLDVEGATEDEDVAAAIDGLRSKAESVRLLGSYPLGADGIPA